MKKNYSIFKNDQTKNNLGYAGLLKKTCCFLLFLMTTLSYGQKTFGTALDLSEYISIGKYKTGTIDTSDGATATGMQGACSAIPCCSTYVYKFTPKTKMNLYVENDNFQPLAVKI